MRALSHELQFKRNLAQLLSVNLVSSLFLFKKNAYLIFDLSIPFQDYEYALCLGVYEMALLSPPLSEENKGDVERMIHFLRSTKGGSAMHKLTPGMIH